MSDLETRKPRWRGVLHQWAAVVTLGLGAWLVPLARTAPARAAVAVYVASLAACFGLSALYHRIEWRPAPRMWLRRADHASIYLLIGGTYTPVALLGMGGASGHRLFIAVWSGAALGMLVSLFWPRAPKPVSAVLAVAVGWTIVPYIGEVRQALPLAVQALILGGGVAYTVGAVIYAMRRPNPVPGVFGYHEVFHALTVVAAGLHFAAVVAILSPTF